MKKVTLWLLAILCVVTCSVFAACGEPVPTNQKSDDNSIIVTMIDGHVVTVDNEVTVTQSTWESWQTKDLTTLTECAKHELATFTVMLDIAQKRVMFLVTSESEKTATHYVTVNVLSNDTTLTLTEVNGVSVERQGTAYSLKVTSEEWTEWTSDKDYKALSNYTLADGATLKVTFDRARKRIVYAVTAEDGETKSETTVAIAIQEVIGQSSLVLDGVHTSSQIAKSHWFAEYTDKGINIQVDVLDNNVYTGNADVGYNDNIEFIIGKHTKKHTFNEGDVKVLVSANGSYFLQKIVGPYSWGPSNDPSIGLIYGNNFTHSGSPVNFSTGAGYRVKVFIGYELMGLTKAEAVGNLAIAPAIRNSSAAGNDASGNTKWTSYTGMDCNWEKAYTYLTIEEDGTFVNSVTKYYSDVDYLFFGDSWINTAFWQEFDVDFGGHNAINIGFGGSHIQDWQARLDQIASFNPDQIVFHIGTNDINGGEDATAAGTAIVSLTQSIHNRLPNAKLHFISIDPCIGHFGNWSRHQVANALVKAEADAKDYLNYIDLASKLLNDDGTLVTSMYGVNDNCHLSPMGTALFVKEIYTALGLEWKQGEVFGDSGIYTHSLGFTSETGATTSTTHGFEQHTFFKDFAGTEFYAEFEVEAHKVFQADAFPKFGFTMDNGVKQVYFYIDAFAGLNGTAVSAVTRDAGGTYLWGNRPVADVTVAGLRYTNGAKAKLGLLRTGGKVYFFVNDTLAYSFNDPHGTDTSVVGAFTFNTQITLTNGMITADAGTIASKLPA